MVRPYDPSIDGFLAYKPGWSGGLTTVEDGNGYWVSMLSDDTLTVTGTTMPEPPSPPLSYDVAEGWNPISFTSTEEIANKVYLANLIDDGSPNYDILYGFNAEEQEYYLVYFRFLGGEGGNMEPGYGYWLWATAEGTIMPPT